MFIAELFTIDKIWKQSKCPATTDEWIYKMEYYLTMRKKEILPFATTWMDPNIMLNEISQTEKDKYCMISLICGI